MGYREFEMGIVLVTLAAVLSGGGVAMAQSSNCTSALVSLAPCLGYITGNASAPSMICCSQLSSVVGSYPMCLCSVVNNPPPAAAALNINRTLALQLPAACRLQTPPLSQCNAATGPATSVTPPVAPPVGSPVDESPGTATTPSAAASVPATSVNSPLTPPLASPVDESPGTATTQPAGQGSKTSPSTDAGSSDANMSRTPLNSLLFAVLTTSFAFILTRL